MGDVVLLNETKDVGASNRRYLAALYCGSTSGFEVPTQHPALLHINLWSWDNLEKHFI